MRLHTLGGLRLEGSGLQRPKPLVLLAYLRLEGVKPRRYVAELFWPDASDPMNSLSVALGQIRKAAPGAVSADESRVWTEITCDALELIQTLRTDEAETALSLYEGVFLEGAETAGLGVELEEWVFSKREHLAGLVRDVLIEHAERQAGLGQFNQAARHAETALRMIRTTAPDPDVLVRLHPLLVAGGSPHAETVRTQATDWSLQLNTSQEEARGKLRHTFVGRETELERLLGLAAGEWAWVRGGPGVGKTALLRRLEHLSGGTHLPARSGLPFATLEPLLGADVGTSNEGVLLRKLSALTGTWLLDGWESMDAESQGLLERLRRFGTKARVVISSREEPAFDLDVHLELGAFTARALEQLPGAFEATGGVPALLEAWLRHEPLETALEVRLSNLEDATPEVPVRDVHGALALLEIPNLGLVRQALRLDAGSFAQALEQLMGAGLIEASGLVRGRETALRTLEAHPALEGRLALALARQLDGPDALTLYRQARALWESEDQPRLARAYRDWALEALRRGFPQRAAEALFDAPPELGLTTLRVRALERAGQYREALEGLRDLPSSPEVKALRGTLLWRLGRPNEARQAAESALEGNDESRAEALNTLGLLELSGGHYTQALGHFRRSATLWLAIGERERWAGALNNQAVARAELGEDAEAAFKEALEAAGDHAVQRVLVLLSLGRVHERRSQTDQAQTLYQQAAALAEDAGALGSAARAWNNLGALYHRLEQPAEARNAYRHALGLAHGVGERLLIGTVLANLAELDDDRESLEEALRLFEQAGHMEMAERYRKQFGV
jgi:tetratricopeptide (TPR) repeat protein